MRYLNGSISLYPIKALSMVINDCKSVNKPTYITLLDIRYKYIKVFYSKLRACKYAMPVKGVYGMIYLAILF